MRCGFAGRAGHIRDGIRHVLTGRTATLRQGLHGRIGRDFLLRRGRIGGLLRGACGRHGLVRGLARRQGGFQFRPERVAATGVLQRLIHLLARGEGRCELIGRGQGHGLLLLGFLRVGGRLLPGLHRRVRRRAFGQALLQRRRKGIVAARGLHGLVDILTGCQRCRQLIGGRQRNGLFLRHRVLTRLGIIGLGHGVAGARAVRQGVFQRAGKGIATTGLFQRLVNLLARSERRCQLVRRPQLDFGILTRLGTARRGLLRIVHRLIGVSAVGQGVLQPVDKGVGIPTGALRRIGQGITDILTAG